MLEPTITPINLAVAGVSNLIPAFPGYRTVILELVIYNLAVQNIEFLQDGVSLSGPWNAFPANSGFTRFAGICPMWPLQPGKALQINCGVGTQVSGYILSVQVPAQEEIMRYIYGYGQIGITPLTPEIKQQIIQALENVL